MAQSNLRAFLGWIVWIVSCRADSLISRRCTELNVIGGKYRFIHCNDSLGWQAANDWCQMKYEGDYKLASIHSIEDLNKIAGLVDQLERSYNLFWIGGSRAHPSRGGMIHCNDIESSRDSNHWEWVNGEPWGSFEESDDFWGKCSPETEPGCDLDDSCVAGNPFCNQMYAIPCNLTLNYWICQNNRSGGGNGSERGSTTANLPWIIVIIMVLSICIGCVVFRNRYYRESVKSLHEIKGEEEAERMAEKQAKKKLKKSAKKSESAAEEKKSMVTPKGVGNELKGKKTVPIKKASVSTEVSLASPESCGVAVKCPDIPAMQALPMNTGSTLPVNDGEDKKQGNDSDDFDSVGSENEKTGLLQVCENEGEGFTTGEWRVEDVIEWVKESVGLPEYADMFASNRINGKVLLSLTENDLQRIGVTVFGHQRMILLEIKQLQRRV